MRSNFASGLAWSAYTVAQAAMESRIPWESTESLLSRQNRRVRRIIRFAWEHVPFYRREMLARGLHPEDFRSAADLDLLPLIDGQIYARNPHLFQPQDALPTAGLVLQSSGTSGSTKQLRHDRRSLLLALAHGHRQRHVLAHFTGRVTGYRELNLVRDGSVASQIRSFYEDHLWTPRRVDLTRAVLTPGELPLDAEIARINDFMPDVLMGYGSYLGALFLSAARRGLKIHRPRAVVYGADSMPAPDRAYLETELGIPVISTYQSTEALRIGFQCELRRGLHVSIDAVAVRIADAGGRTVPPGQPGDVIISNLTNRATVLLNYRLGDVAVFGSEPCPCGRTLPVIDSLEGRSDDLIHLADGRSLHALQVMRRLRTASSVERIQVVQQDHQSFSILAVDAGLPDRKAASSALVAELSSLTGSHPSISVEWVDALPAGANGKTRLVISNPRS
jgi:phenylacetate-CoA ligase